MRNSGRTGHNHKQRAVGFPSVDAPFQARENFGIVVARGRMLSSVRPLMRQEDSRRPVWEFADRVQITRSVLEALWKALVVPAPSRRLLRHTLLPLALTSSRSWPAYAATAGVSVGAAFDQQGPDDAGHLVGQSNGDQHFRLASQHLRKPRALGCPAPAGLLNHGTRPNDQQAADRPFTAFRNGTEFLLAAGRFLQRRQSEPGREIAPGRKPLGRGHQRSDCRRGNWPHAWDCHQPACRRV